MLTIAPTGFAAALQGLNIAPQLIFVGAFSGWGWGGDFGERDERARVTFSASPPPFPSHTRALSLSLSLPTSFPPGPIGAQINPQIVNIQPILLYAGPIGVNIQPQGTAKERERESKGWVGGRGRARTHARTHARARARSRSSAADLSPLLSLTSSHLSLHPPPPPPPPPSSSSSSPGVNFQAGGIGVAPVGKLVQPQGYLYSPAKTIYGPTKVLYNPQKGPVYAPVGDDLTTLDDNVGASADAGAQTGGGGL